jgi:hypothetical protein
MTTPDLTISGHTKVTPHHTQRIAYVYIRQSSPGQVLHHKESQINQARMADYATALGWTTDQVRILTSDQGLTGATSQGRDGFHELISEVTLGQVGSSTRSCKIIGMYAEGAVDHDWKLRQWLESTQTGQIDGFSPLILLSVPRFGTPGNANYAAIGISGVRRMSPTVITRSVMPRAMAGVRSRYLRFKPGTGSRNDSCGRARW